MVYLFTSLKTESSNGRAMSLVRPPLAMSYGGQHHGGIECEWETLVTRQEAREWGGTIFMTHLFRVTAPPNITTLRTKLVIYENLGDNLRPYPNHSNLLYHSIIIASE
jgi:hypothetical protein